MFQPAARFIYNSFKKSANTLFGRGSVLEMALEVSQTAFASSGFHHYTQNSHAYNETILVMAEH